MQNTPEIQSQNFRHVDGCEFWKDQYERIHQENKELKDKVRLLEMRQRVSERIPSPDLGDQEGGRSSTKRPADFEGVEEWLEDQEWEVGSPIGDKYLRLSSYSRFWTFEFINDC